MKAEFFAIAVLVLLGGVYAAYAAQDMRRHHRNEYTMTISSDGYYEQIRHSGEIRINADETGFDSISAGGFFSYKRNSQTIKVVCDSPGVLRTTWVEDGQQRVFDAKGKRVLAEAIRELIVYGFDAEGRASRIYQQGGVRALVTEAGQMKSDAIKGVYLAEATRQH